MLYVTENLSLRRHDSARPVSRPTLTPALGSFLLAVMVGTLLRLWLLSTSSGLTMDSPLYVNMAEAAARGQPALGPAHHGYPWLMALAHLVIPGREWPGRVVSLVAGVALLVLAWPLARRSLTPGWASLVVWLLALHPLLAVWSGAVMTEAVFIALIYGALLLLDRHRLAAGATLGLGFVVRPEALVIAPAMAATAGRRDFWLVLAGFALVVAPYLGYLRWERGSWSLGPKVALVRPMFENEREREWRIGAAKSPPPVEPTSLVPRLLWAAPSIARSYVPNLMRHLGLLVAAWPPPLLLLSLLGLPRRRWVLLAPLAPLLVLPLLSVAFEMRFAQIFVPALALLAAQGAAWIVARPAWQRPEVVAAIVSVAALGTGWAWAGPAGRVARHFDDGPMAQMRDAGVWLAAHGRPDAVVMDRKAYVPFFAGMRHMQLPDDDYDALVAFAQRSADYVVVEEYLIPTLRPQLLQLVHDPEFRNRERRLRAAYVTGEEPGTGVAVFEVVRDSLAAPR